MKPPPPPATPGQVWATALRLRLAAGLRRDRDLAPLGQGCPGLPLVALATGLLGLGLLLFGGYQAAFLPLNRLATVFPDGLWEGLTVLGDARLAVALALFFSLRHPRLFWALILAALAATVLTHGLKPWVAAWRPPAVLPAEAFHLIGPALRKSSFPSGHAMTVAVLTGVGWCFLRRPASHLLLVCLAVTIGLSRVAVGVHWPIDVAAGLAGGWAAAWLGIRLADRWEGLAGRLAVHLTCVVLAAGAAVLLLIDDGGYARSRPLQLGVGLSALGWGLSQYLLLPRRSQAR
ncbi:MAG: phosphatase PAP2 family protein [Gammaproteobacteria bacterium]|nr:phosphatase PAP2 family protein [Gammaproteobacteria bacterium]